MALVKPIGARKASIVPEPEVLPVMVLPQAPAPDACQRCGGPVDQLCEVWTGEITDMVDYMIHEMFNEFDEMAALKPRFQRGCRACYDFQLLCEDEIRPMIFAKFLYGKNMAASKS